MMVSLCNKERIYNQAPDERQWKGSTTPFFLHKEELVEAQCSSDGVLGQKVQRFS